MLQRQGLTKRQLQPGQQRWQQHQPAAAIQQRPGVAHVARQLVQRHTPRSGSIMPRGNSQDHRATPSNTNAAVASSCACCRPLLLLLLTIQRLKEVLLELLCCC
jgi:hypothetical protein